MSLIAEGVLSGKILLEETLAAFPDATVEARYQATPGSAILLVEDCEFETFEAALVDDRTVEDVERIAESEGRRVYQIGIAPDRRMLAAEGAKFGIQVLSIVADEGNWRLRLRAQDREALVGVRELAADLRLSFRVRTVYRERPDRSAVVLTPAQEELVETAYENGYFAQPRESSLEDLAERLDISPSAASGRLRRAMEALVAETVADEGSDGG
jgi:hypothetical protein